MANVFIIHGTQGYPGENWFPWLKEELTKLGHKVIVPQFPTPENQTLENWFAVFDKYKKYYDKDIFLIGHSLGGAFSLRLLEKYSVKIRAAFIIAAPCGKMPSIFPNSDMSFVGHPFDWKRIKKNAKKFYILHSSDDPIVPIGNSKEIAKKLQADLIVLENSGHFNAKTGYLKFEFLLDLIKMN